MPYFVVGARALLALVFVASAVSKLRPGGFGAFVTSLRRLTVVSDRLARPCAIAVVITEVAIPLLMLTGTTAVAGFVVATGLLAVFSTAIVVTLRRGTAAPCRCFGASGTPLGRRHLVRNCILIAAALAAGLAAAVDRATELHPAPLAMALTAAVCIAAVVIRFDDVADLFGASPVAATAGDDNR